MEDRDARWISVAEIARHLGMALDTVYRWIDSRGMPARRVGHFWKFQLSDVDAWVKSGEADIISNGAGSDERFGDATQQGR